jgi:hypothetical protein
LKEISASSIRRKTEETYVRILRIRTNLLHLLHQAAID